MIDEAAALLRASRNLVAFTGAGISTESGIPDFRTPRTGRWATYDVKDFAYGRFVASSDARKRYWAWAREFWPAVRDARPNDAHHALVELERRGRLGAVITQNVDELHQKAGSSDVIELHGSSMRVACLGCARSWPRQEIHARLEAGEEEPACTACGGILKPTVVQFGQGMPPEATKRAFDEAAACDLLLVVGSSLVVNPAAQLVPTALRAGARVVLINLAPTPYDERVSVVLRGKAGETLTTLLALC